MAGSPHDFRSERVLSLAIYFVAATAVQKGRSSAAFFHYILVPYTACMKYAVLALLLVASGLIYKQSSDIDALKASILTLEAKVGGVAGAADMLSGQIDSVAGLASTTAASAAEIAAKQAIPVKSQDDIVREAVAKVSPAVVSIVKSRPGDNDRISSATGFFVRSNGYLVTNRHVVADEDDTLRYTVTLTDGRTAVATAVWKDATHDLAILKIDGSGYPVVSLGDSSTLAVGQSVFAIGNALGRYDNSVSTGVISGLNRTITATGSGGSETTLTGVIQTDAGINKGNSGGPLIDLSGKAIGVNVATVINVENISFSVPISEVRSALASLGI